MTTNKDQVLENLRASVENTVTHADGTVWGEVYLDNASSGMPMATFKACLAQLAEEGLYRRYDGVFGYVRQ